MFRLTLMASTAFMVVGTASAQTAAPVPSTGSPVFDAFVSFACVALPVIGGFLVKFARAHWAILNDAAVNQALYAGALRIASVFVSELSATFPPTATTPIVVDKAHPVISEGANLLVTRYPDFAAHVDMNVNGAKDMMLAAMAEVSKTVPNVDVVRNAAMVPSVTTTIPVNTLGDGVSNNPTIIVP